ncbi:MAG: hypothetical protein WCG03_06970 [Kiritimatiellales bacterium]
MFTYYPTPDGQYTTSNSTSSSTFATTGGQNVYLGYSQTSVTTDAALPVGSQVLQSVGPSATFDSDLFLTGTIVQDDWTPVNAVGGANPTFLHAWVNYDATYNTAGYFRDKNGIVYLKGLVKSGAVSTGVTAGVPDGAIFQLPVGYRPEKQQIRVVMTNANVEGRCDIDTNGYVIAMEGSSSWFSLDGVTFRAKGY